MVELGDGYMAKIRHIVVIIASIIYLMLFFMNGEIPHNIFILLLGIMLISQVIDDFNTYKKTKKKIHLLIPMTTLVIIISALILKLFGFR